MLPQRDEGSVRGTRLAKPEPSPTYGMKVLKEKMMFDFEFKAQSRADDQAEIDLEGKGSRQGPLTDKQRDDLLIGARTDAALAVVYAKSTRNVALAILVLVVFMMIFLRLQLGSVF